MGTVHKLPVGRNVDIERAVEGLAQALREAVEVAVGSGAEFELQEKKALELTNEATRRVLESRLQEIADSHPDEVKINGWHYHRHQPGKRAYHSLCGPLEVERWTYRRCDVRNGPTVVPLELEVGMVERCTPALAYSMALGYARGPMREYEGDMHAAYREPPSRATLERVAKAIGTEVKRSVTEIEPAVRKKERLPEGAYAICIGLDRTSAPMEEPRAEAQSPRTRRKKRTKPYQRKPPPPVEVHYRMPYVCTVTIVDEDGEVLVTRSYTALAQDGPEGPLGRMVEDVRWALSQDETLELAVVMDAAPELWGWIWDTFNALLPGQEYHQLIDFYHYMERLARALELIEPEQEKRRQLLEYWADRLQRFHNAPDRLGEWLESQVPRRKVRAYRDQVMYLTGYWTRTTYARFRKLGLPIGSGFTEGACKYLIRARTKRSGQRWHTEGLDAVLTLRAMHHSERLPAFWNLFKRNYREVVRPAA